METRNRKKCKLSAEMEGDTSLNSAPEYYFPPEIMEIIIGYLEEDPKQLMKYRLVNRYWASVMKSCIERNILSNLMRWNNGLKWVPDHPIRNLRTRETPPEPFPLLSLVSKGRSCKARPEAVYTPLKFGDGGNPFPTGSLTIRRGRTSVNYQRNLKKLNHKMNVEELLCNFGEHLTSFAFHSATVTFPELETMMKYLPNLKTLSISKITLRKGSENLVGSQTSLFPTRLTHVQAVREISPQIIQWLVDRCAHQLISLDVDASELMPFRQPPTPSRTAVPYQKLNYLNLYKPSLSFLELTEVFPLKRIYITNNKAQKLVHKVSVDDVFYFLQKFRNTMVEYNGHLKFYCDNCEGLFVEYWVNWVGQRFNGQVQPFYRTSRNKKCPLCSRLQVVL